ncbi:MAG TPA: dehypoxanthine futalosine cyclase [Pseudacidobacterium sp.]|jgi:cyclic dehypoxanthinyl futalosine synthase|nr:dehypoxanthine futalosine cyclase [Pseudacidobacterium sp.]
MPITRQQALDFFLSDDLIGLGMEAGAVRNKKHPEGVVTYLVDGAAASDSDADADISAVDSTGIQLQSAAGHSIEWFEQSVNSIRQRFPQTQLRGFTVPELLALAKRSDLSLHETLLRLRDAGLDSISDASFEIPHHNGHASSSFERWLRAHRTAHELGMRTSASITFGAGESFEQRLDALDQIRQLQEESGGFIAFTPLSYAPERELDAPTGVEYLKMLAISRLYLTNIENIQASSASQGLKVLQMGLRFGANDAGAVWNARSTNRAREEDLRRIIRDAGYRPAQRDPLYRTMFLN